MTRYVVLEQVELAGALAWVQVPDGDVEARSDIAAIRSVAAAGTYVAIPVRSFTPRVVRVETHTRIRLDTETS